MLILLDNNVPRGVAQVLTGHIVTEARERSWATLENGELLSAAEAAGFDVLLTADKNIRYQQNLERSKIAIVVLTMGRWALIRGILAEVAAAVNSAQPGSYLEIAVKANE